MLVTWGARRVNRLGVLVPLALPVPVRVNLAGLGTTVVGWMGLI